MSSELTEFFEKKTSEEENNNWEEIKNDWLKTLEDFNTQIITWLDEPIKKGFVKYEIKMLNISEYLMGNYQAPSLVLISGKDKISFKPIGKLVLGFNGRIDIVSFTDNKTLVEVKDKGWFLFEQSKKEGLKPFDETLFTELLKEMFS